MAVIFCSSVVFIAITGVEFCRRFLTKSLGDLHLV